MANYNEKAITGTTWTRCNSIHITNDFGHNAVARFGEQSIIIIGNTKNITGPYKECSVIFEPTKTFPQIDPSTGEPTGATHTHAELYSLLYSLYIDTAKARDTVEEALAAEVEAVRVALAAAESGNI